MQDQNLPHNDKNVPVHVDDYQPPQASAQPFNAPTAPVDPTNGVAPTDNTQPKKDSLSVLEDIIANSKSVQNDPMDDQPTNDISQNAQSNQNNNPPEESVETEVSESPLTDQSLETQNIFDLLGVNDGKDEEKEAFLDELQEVIWEDFIENDVDLLLNDEQVAKLREIESKGQSREVQEEMLVYLEEILPDLEDIMMDKALELKEDMVLERISGMKEFHSGNQQALDQISKAEDLISENKWADAGNVLNSVK